jgi:hypothetical protein
MAFRPGWIVASLVVLVASSAAPAHAGLVSRWKERASFRHDKKIVKDDTRPFKERVEVIRSASSLKMALRLAAVLPEIREERSVSGSRVVVEEFTPAEVVPPFTKLENTLSLTAENGSSSPTYLVYNLSLQHAGNGIKSSLISSDRLSADLLQKIRYHLPGLTVARLADNLIGWYQGSASARSSKAALDAMYGEASAGSSSNPSASGPRR